MNKLDWDCLYCSRVNPYYLYSCVGCNAPKQRCRERGIKRRDIIECPDPLRPGQFIEIGRARQKPEFYFNDGGVGMKPEILFTE
jgi:hypothetical protein